MLLYRAFANDDEARTARARRIVHQPSGTATAGFVRRQTFAPEDQKGRFEIRFLRNFSTVTMYQFETSDLQLAAYALLQGGNVISIDRNDRKRAVFLLETKIPVVVLKERFRNRPTVALQDFVASQAEVKKALFSDVY